MSIAAGHAVAKEVLVSKQELDPQSWFRRLDAAGVDFKLHLYFIYVGANWVNEVAAVLFPPLATAL